jgi:diguanylate cyclase (GGDEF)-like protein
MIKVYMKLHSSVFQITITFFVFVITPIIVTSLIGIQQLSNEVKKAYIPTVEKAASLIDGDAFEALVKSQDINSPFYKETLAQLRLLREYSNCLYLYTIAPVNGDIWQFIIDASEEQDEIGTKEDVSTYDKAFKKALNLGTAEAANLEYQEYWGWLISMYAPIKNTSGKIVGIVAADYAGEQLHNSIVAQRKLWIIIGGISTILGLPFLYLFLFKVIKLNKKLESLSTTDELTKLNNRRAFLNYYEIIWKQGMRMRFPINVLLIDIDYFKKYNDSLGHLEGDKALIAIAQCMKNKLKRDTDFIARFGGEEFVCLLPYIEKEKAVNFTNDLVKSVENMEINHPMNEVSKYITISAGIASVVPNENYSQKQLLDEADKALYLAKQSGRNRVIVYGNNIQDNCKRKNGI